MKQIGNNGHKPKNAALVLLAAIVVCGCAQTKYVRQEDLASWVGAPVDALNFHPVFLGIPMTSRVDEKGVEIRNYSNSISTQSCVASGSSLSVGTTSFNGGQANCIENRVVCNNVFFIKDGYVVEYRPIGRCYTDETVRPVLDRLHDTSRN